MSLYTRRNAADAAEGTSVVLIGAVVVVLVCFLVGALIWGLGVFSSGAKGAGDQERQKNSVTNRVFWENEFNSLSQNIATYQAQIASARASAAAHPGDSFYEQNLTGLLSECYIAVGQYNADTAKPIASPWLPAGLPVSYDRSTVCGG